MFNKKLISSPDSESLLIDLYKYSANDSKKVIRAKISPQTKHYPELEIFKQQMEENKGSVKHHTYEVNSGKVFRYRLIFFAFGLLFLGLSLAVFQKNVAFTHILYGNIFSSLKSMVIVISLSFAFLSIGFGYSLCVAKEAAHQIAAKTKRRLLRAYTKKRIELGLAGLISYGWNYYKYSSLKQTYHSAYEKIEDQKEETVHLLKKIRNSNETDEKEKELLFNQAIGEMNQKLRLLVQNYKDL